jgi:hypothetical protein
MFKNLLRRSKHIYFTKTKGVITIPEGTAIQSAKKIWDMIEWIYAEFVSDCKNTKKIDLKNNPFGNNNFQTRNTSRTISYVIHICLLDGIIHKVYKDFVRDYKKYINNKKIKNNKIIPKKLSNEIKKIKEFRHMVAAHTIYSSPDFQKGDNTSSMLTSLLPFSSYGLDIDGSINSFFVGGGPSIIVGNDAGHRDIPQISIYKSFPLIKKYFISKESNFLKLLIGRRKIYIDK